MLAIKPRPTLKEDFVFRAATMDDLETAVELFNICSEAQIGAHEATVDDTGNEWRTPGFDLERSTRIVESPDGRLVGYIEVWDLDEIPAHPWVWGRVHPDFEGQGIGTRLMAWAEERARQAIARVPDDARVAFHAGTVSTYEPAMRLFKELGMKLIRHFWRMVINLDERPPKPQWPEGITLRTYVDLPDLPTIYHAFDDAFQDHWGHIDQPLEDRLKRWQHWIENDKEFDPTLWFLAMDGDEIAGLSLCHPKAHDDPEMGFVNVLGVRRPWRRQGLALALLHHSFGEFYRRGQKRAGLGVDAGSLTGATRLYEKAGMHVDRQYDDYEMELRPGRELAKQSLEE